MAIYEEYYEEVKDAAGRIVRVETRYPQDFNFAYDVVDQIALRTPDRTALVHRSSDGKRTVLSFGDLKRLSDRTANALRSLGIVKGDAVMLLLKRRYEFWVIILALHKLGAVAVPTSHMVSSEDIRERVKKSRAKAIFCVGEESICQRVENAIAG
ncbi:MAG: AMP-binding protein, partial [Acetatifactor sp.]|nr:AMP-binding protein [Acetatifactor sp.]